MRPSTHPSSWRSSRWRSREEQRLQIIDLVLKILVPAFLFVCFVAALKFGSFNGFLELVNRQSYATPILALGAVFTLCVLAFQVLRTMLWWRYRPYLLPSGPLPAVTVIIPAYNEGAMVEQSISAVAASDYPADRLEIICIDDGSKDDTWSYIHRAQKRFPHLVKAIRFPKNRGKKEGLYTGFSQGRGEIFVTIDSDSLITRDTLKQMVAPMLADPRVGAVAGNVKVHNRFRSLLARMLAVRFVLAFDFLRASQSMYGGVTCTPGALSAYRRQAILPILNEWRHQTFMGRPATIGEDRALTNCILRQGFYSVYQRAALVYTTVPETYRGLCKMFLRWDRGQLPGVLGANHLPLHQLPPTGPDAPHPGLFRHPGGIPPDLPLHGDAPGLLYHLPGGHDQILCRSGGLLPDLYVLLLHPGAGLRVCLRHPLLLLRLLRPQLGAALRLPHPPQRPLAHPLAGCF